MSILFEVDLEKLRRTTWGHGQALSQSLGITERSLSRKLNRKQPILVGEINQILKHLNLDARDFVYFIDNEKKAEIRNAA